VEKPTNKQREKTEEENKDKPANKQHEETEEGSEDKPAQKQCAETEEESEDKPAKKQCIEADAKCETKDSGNAKNKSIDDLIEDELKEMGERNKLSFRNCNCLKL